MLIGAVFCSIAIISVHGWHWERIPGGLIHISANPRFLWGVNRHHHIFKCARPCRGHWIRIDGLLKQIDAGDSEVWGVNANDDIFKRPVDGSGHWTHIPGKLKHVSASG